jgi:ligand-binding SRPBCC domain-containing protein
MTHSWKSELWLPSPPGEVFAFVSDATTLDRLTPPWLGVRVLSPGPIRMAVGTTIEYRLRLRGVPLRWRTMITGWDPPHGFAERQMHGPFHSCAMEHRFTACDGGTRMLDSVEFDVLGGAWISRLYVGPEFARIHAYRARRLRERFGCGPFPRGSRLLGAPAEERP